MGITKFEVADRCDRCGAQAYCVARKNNSVLLFCLHHRAENYDALCAAGWTLKDDAEAIERVTKPHHIPA